MKNRKSVVVKLFLASLFALSLSCCASMGVALGGTLVFDASVPETEQCVLHIGGYLTVTSFDGTDVKWKSGSKVSIPAGKHTIALSYYAQERSGDWVTTYTDEHTMISDFIPCRIYGLDAERKGMFVSYSAYIRGMTEFAVQGEDETLVVLTKKGRAANLPVDVFIDGKYKIYIKLFSAKEEVKLILPKGKHSFSGEFVNDSGISVGWPRSEPVEFEMTDNTLYINVGIAVWKPRQPPTFEVVNSGE